MKDIHRCISLEKKGFIFSKMASRYNPGEDTGDKDSIWVIDQQIDQPMEEESKRLKNAYQEKVRCKSLPHSMCVCVF